LPATNVAKEYYRDGDLYMFDEMHHATQQQKGKDIRRPKCDTLYHVFCNIRDDEMEHVKTMEFLQQEDANLVRQPQQPPHVLVTVTNVTEVAVYD
jgi:ubiquinol oxidase